jgi:hypothetical protein
MIDTKIFIRIVPTSEVTKYFEEVNKTYGDTIDVSSDLIKVLYNCADFHERLVHDLRYKKFKGISSTETCPGLWCIDTPTNVNEWWKETYLPWVTSKLLSYIEDLDEDAYFDIVPEQEDWGFVADQKITQCIFDEVTKYKLLNVERTNDGKYVLTRNHLLCLVLDYVNNNHGSILGFGTGTTKLPETEDAIPSVDLDCTSCDNVRGSFINKDVLTTLDVQKLLSVLNISNDVLKRVTTCRNYVKILEGEALTRNIVHETSAFGAWYQNLDDSSFDASDNAIDVVFANAISVGASTATSLPQPMTVMRPFFELGTGSTEQVFLGFETVKQADNPPKPSTQVVYKNLINNSINVFDVELTYLKELQRLSSITYNTDVTKTVLETINKQKVSTDIIKELQQLLDILEDGQEEGTTKEDKIAPDENNAWSLQKLITKTYVDLYKNDTLETLASTVIENVYEYLLQGSLAQEQINKNQIGKDLVELGVRKTRKSKGYVYGIEDTTSKGKKDPKIEVDIDRVSKDNHQLRCAYTPDHATLQQPWPFSFPGRFLVPSTK